MQLSIITTGEESLESNIRFAYGKEDVTDGYKGFTELMIDYKETKPQFLRRIKEEVAKIKTSKNWEICVSTDTPIALKQILKQTVLPASKVVAYA